MKKVILILSFIFPSTLFCQWWSGPVSECYYRDTVLERIVLDNLNEYRKEKGLRVIVYDPDNYTAVPWGKYLITLKGRLSHSHCPSAEILANLPLGWYESQGLDVAKAVIKAWDNSLSHKRIMIDSTLTRGVFAAFVYVTNDNDCVYIPRSGRYQNPGEKRVMVVGQFLRSKEYYQTKDYLDDQGFHSSSCPFCFICGAEECPKCIERRKSN